MHILTLIKLVKMVCVRKEIQYPNGKKHFTGLWNTVNKNWDENSEITEYWEILDTSQTPETKYIGLMKNGEYADGIFYTQLNGDRYIGGYRSSLKCKCDSKGRPTGMGTFRLNSSSPLIAVELSDFNFGIGKDGVKGDYASQMFNEFAFWQANCFGAESTQPASQVIYAHMQKTIRMSMELYDLKKQHKSDIDDLRECTNRKIASLEADVAGTTSHISWHDGEIGERLVKNDSQLNNIRWSLSILMGLVIALCFMV